MKWVNFLRLIQISHSRTPTGYPNPYATLPHPCPESDTAAPPCLPLPLPANPPGPGPSLPHPRPASPAGCSFAECNGTARPATSPAGGSPVLPAKLGSAECGQRSAGGCPAECDGSAECCGPEPGRVPLPPVPAVQPVPGREQLGSLPTHSDHLDSARGYASGGNGGHTHPTLKSARHANTHNMLPALQPVSTLFLFVNCVRPYY